MLRCCDVAERVLKRSEQAISLKLRRCDVAERVLKKSEYPKVLMLRCFLVAGRGAKKLREPKSLSQCATRLLRVPQNFSAPIHDVAKLRCCNVANLKLLPPSCPCLLGPARWVGGSDGQGLINLKVFFLFCASFSEQTGEDKSAKRFASQKVISSK